MEHDEQCRDQDARLSRIETQQARHDERMNGIDASLESAIDRMQEAVDIENELKTTVGVLKSDVMGELRRVAATAEMTRNILFAGIGTFLLAVLGAVAAFIIAGGLKTS